MRKWLGVIVLMCRWPVRAQDTSLPSRDTLSFEGNRRRVRLPVGGMSIRPAVLCRRQDRPHWAVVGSARAQREQQRREVHRAVEIDTASILLAKPSSPTCVLANEDVTGLCVVVARGTVERPVSPSIRHNSGK